MGLVPYASAVESLMYSMCVHIWIFVLLLTWSVISKVIQDLLIGKQLRRFFVIYLEWRITCFIIKEEQYVCLVILMSIRAVV